MPTRSKTSAIATMEDARFDKFFDEVIASPELNLLSDDFEQIETNEDAIFTHPPSYPISHQHHPILHRLQPVIPPPISILKSHVIPQPTSTPTTGGISPTLTWSGDASPTNQSNSPGLHDMDEDDFVNLGCSNVVAGVAVNESDNAWNNPLFNPNGGRISSRRNSSATRSTRSRDSSHSRSRSSCSDSITGGDDDPLAMSTLSLVSSTSTHVDQDGTTILSFKHLEGAPNSPPARKKARTTSRSSVDSVMMELSGPGQANRLIPTGHRRNITSASLVPLDAPTQVRHYLTPSSTSKKETPSAFVARKNKLKAKEATLRSGKKRVREEEPEEEEEGGNERDELGAVDVDDMSSEQSSLLSAIEAKRRQNTLAARRSRQRKLDYVRNLEELLGVMTRERDEWKERAEKAEFTLGGPVLDDDE